MKLRDIVLRNDTAAGRAFNWAITLLIVYFLITLSIGTLPNLPVWAADFLNASDYVVFGLFTIEYAVRIAAAPSKRKYLFSFYGILDLVALAPFYLTVGLDLAADLDLAARLDLAAGLELEAVRVVRLFGVVQLLRLVRYSDAASRFRRALALAKEELVLVLTVAAVLLFVSSVGIYHFERNEQPEEFGSVLHSMWWAIVTLTTVGYGDVYPTTPAGKIFTGVVMVCGLAVVAVPAGIMASALSEVRAQERSQDRKTD